MKRCVVITGSEGGIGRELVDCFKRHSIHVIGIDCHATSQSSCDQYIELDVSDVAAIECADGGYYEALHAAIRGKQLIGLINNAALQLLGSFESLELDQWERVIRVNLLAPIALSRIFLSALRAGEGAIVNISSVHATQTKPNFTAYATSKAAFVGLSKAMAVELGGQVRVMCLCPAAIETNMLRQGLDLSDRKYGQLLQCHPTKSIGNPQSLAELVSFLVLLADKFVNGLVLNYDGGISWRLHDPE